MQCCDSALTVTPLLLASCTPGKSVSYLLDGQAIDQRMGCQNISGNLMHQELRKVNLSTRLNLCTKYLK